MVHLADIFLKMSLYEIIEIPGRCNAEKIIFGIIDFHQVGAEPVVETFLYTGVI